MNNFSGATEFQILANFAAGTIYFYNAIQLILDYQINRQSALVNAIGLSLTMSFYCALLVLERFGFALQFAEILMHSMWLLAVISGFFYVKSLRLFLEGRSKIALFAEKAVIPFGFLILLSAVINIAGGPKLLFAAPQNLAALPQQSEGLQAFVRPTLFMDILAMIVLTLFFLGASLNAHLAWQKKPRELWLIVGMLFTASALLNDVLTSLGLFSSFSFLFLAKGIELIRVARFFHRFSIARVLELENELG